MGRFDVLAVLVMIGPAMQREAETVIASVNQRAIERGSDEIVSVASLATLGCMARVAGRSVEQVGRRLRQWLGFVPSLLGDDPWQRKW
jgi:urease accessory protein